MIVSAGRKAARALLPGRRGDMIPSNRLRAGGIFLGVTAYSVPPSWVHASRPNTAGEAPTNRPLSLIFPGDLLQSVGLQV
ncbi:Uncharacterised protein [Edwardsiella tarda]|nr:Uncharacterised protein [Edwardsiella tarda]